MAIDWLGDFENKFKSNHMISHLKGMQFHGKVTLNFCNGNPNTAHVEWCVKPFTVNSNYSVASEK